MGKNRIQIVCSTLTISGYLHASLFLPFHNFNLPSTISSFFMCSFPLSNVALSLNVILFILPLLLLFTRNSFLSLETQASHHLLLLPHLITYLPELRENLPPVDTLQLVLLLEDPITSFLFSFICFFIPCHCNNLVYGCTCHSNVGKSDMYFTYSLKHLTHLMSLVQHSLQLSVSVASISSFSIGLL